eukprot:SAG31_NODE_40347_length_281_cov_0.857143_1_plen_52_part_10
MRPARRKVSTEPPRRAATVSQKMSEQKQELYVRLEDLDQYLRVRGHPLGQYA